MPLLMLIAGSAAIAGAARRTPVPAPLLLVTAGLLASYVPGMPDYTLDPEIVLPLLLPRRSCTRPPWRAPTSICGPTRDRSRCSPSAMSCSRRSRSDTWPTWWCPTSR
ncbi:hypothetical protein M2266_006182 [Streptomyces sp. SPB162]|nr:hypothetical protein [Streptomyces sp. SPB162]